jgi:hypothetical protein
MIAQLLFTCVWASQAGGNDDAALEEARAAAMKTFKVEVAHIITTYCFKCHSDKKQKAGVRFD